jgi:hypothetical protein
LRGGDIALQAGRVYGRRHPKETRMDIHDIALKLYAELVSAKRDQLADDASRIALGREAYLYADAFIVAKDIYIRELPVANVEAGY